MAQTWKKGRGKLGPFHNLLGHWTAESETPYGLVTITRNFAPVFDGKFIQLDCRWDIPKKPYSERCIFGPHRDGGVHFWSFQSDGKQSSGWLASGEDVHEQAICFEADMPAGRARQLYWPDAEEGFHWAVESQTKKGWNRFTEHHYRNA